MRVLSRFSSLILLPVFIQLILFYVFYHVNEDLIIYSSLFFFMLLFFCIFFEIFFQKGIDYSSVYQNVYIFVKPKDRLVLSVLGWLIIFLFPLDVYFNGFKLLAPETYAEFNGAGRYIRHITSLCWMLVPIAYFHRGQHKLTALFFIVASIILPIAMIDRNRLFMSFFSLLFMLYIQYQSTELKLNKFFYAKIKKKLLCVLIAVPLVFVILGLYRSGSSFDIESSGDYLIYGQYPLRDIFQDLPSFLQQIVLYITSPIMNFSHIAVSEFRNVEFLLSQISPFSRDQYPAYPYAPVLIVRYNVGTEFYPFLLYKGLPAVFFAMGIVVAMFATIAKIFSKYKNIFTWLLFLKFSYMMVFLGFAPQFYILYNFMGVLAILLLWLFSYLLIPFYRIRMVL